MAYEIAVILGEDGETTGIMEHGKIAVYRRERGQWGIARECVLKFVDSRGMAELRERMRELINFLEGCRIMVGSKINGVPAVILGQSQCRIWECPGRPADFLESHSQITSKQALLPFIRQKKFQTLEIICNHVPGWLEGEVLARHGFLHFSKIDDNQMKVQITGTSEGN